MDRGAWQAIVRWVQESDATEQPVVESVGGPSASGELVIVCSAGLDLALRPSGELQCVCVCVCVCVWPHH